MCRDWRLRTVLATLVALGILWGAPGQPGAQQLPSTVAAVIDYQQVLRDASAARSIREQIEVRRKAYQEEISAQEEQLREAEQSLAKQRSLLAPEAFAEKRREFEKEVAEVQRLVQERRRELDRISAVALNEVKQALIEIVTDLAEERGFNLVLPSSEVLFFARRIDLTEEVMAELDARLPKVDVPSTVN